MGLEPSSFNSQATFSALLKLILSEQWSFKLRYVPTHIGLSGRVKRRNVSPRGVMGDAAGPGFFLDCFPLLCLVLSLPHLPTEGRNPCHASQGLRSAPSETTHDDCT